MSKELGEKSYIDLGLDFKFDTKARARRIKEDESAGWGKESGRKNRIPENLKKKDGFDIEVDAPKKPKTEFKTFIKALEQRVKTRQKDFETVKQIRIQTGQAIAAQNKILKLESLSHPITLEPFNIEGFTDDEKEEVYKQIEETRRIIPEAEKLKKETLEDINNNLSFEEAVDIKKILSDEAAINKDVALKTFSNKWLIGDKLGAGTFGKVFKAEQIYMGRQDALKTFSATINNPREAADFVSDFKTEIQTMAAVRHDNLVNVYAADVKYDAKTKIAGAWMATELVNGVNLENFQYQQELSQEKIVDIFIEVANGLKALHEFKKRDKDGSFRPHPILHRDIKPQNIFIPIESEGPKGKQHVKLGDLGLAKSLMGPVVEENETDEEGTAADGIPSKSGTVKTEKLVGTPHYMAPECLRGESESTKSDIYSLGATMYRIVADTEPFHTEKKGNEMVQDLAVKANFSEAPEIDRKDIHPYLIELIKEMMEKDPDKRPGINAVLETLQGLIKSPMLASERSVLGKTKTDNPIRDWFRRLFS